MIRLLLLLLPLGLMAERLVVEWHRIHFPPSLFYDKTNSYHNKGYSDKPRTFITESLPEYDHVDLPASPNKAMHLAKNDSKRIVCFGGLNKNAEREEFLDFSEPFLLSYPNHIIVKNSNKEIKKAIQEDGTISLKTFLEAGLTLSIAKGRSYSPKIDAVLLSHQKDNLIYPPSSDISHAYLKQVLHKRVDATLDYPTNISYFASTEQKLDSGWFVTYPITEDREMVEVYFACSKISGHSGEVIGKINRLIESNKRRFAESYAEWLSGDVKEHYLEKDGLK